METLNNIITVVNDFLWTYILVIALIVLGIYFTIKTKFVQFRYFKEMFRLLGDGMGKDAKGDGKVSSFQAFCISTASRVGTGNIAGISIAIVGGGPGAIFWMWVVALIGSASSFVESTLAQIYKVRDGAAFRGGPAYYIEQGLKNKKMAILFSILITIAFAFVFNAVQSNTMTVAFNAAFGIDKFLMGIILCALTTAVIFGGVQRIAKITEVIVPIFAVAYILVALFIVFKNINLMPQVFEAIFSQALNFKDFTVGTFTGTILVGIKRGLFSNEAGMGSAPNAAATADTSHPVKQGLIQTLGVFTDTIIICTCTAFMVLLYTQFNTTSGATSIELAQEALSYHIGSLGYTFIAICIFLFAFSSIVGNYYYGQSNIEFIFGENKALMAVFRVLVVGMVLFGSLTKVQIVWDLADVMMALMAIVNLVAITLLGKFAFRALDDYTRQRKAGISNPTFNPANIEGLGKVECWGNDGDEEAAI